MRGMKFEIYKMRSRKPQWAWRLVASNGRKVANGGEGYNRLADLFAITRKLFAGSAHETALHDEINRVRLAQEAVKIRPPKKTLPAI